MLYPLLSKYISFPLLGIILNSIYYGLIYGGILISCVLIYKRMTSVIGIPKRQAAFFITLVFILSFPAGVLSSRAANMFYYPISTWSFDFFIEQLLHGKNQTFHASLVLPAILIFIIMKKMKISLLKGLDTIFLHVPLAHAFGRTGCFLVGCCWGNRISIHLCGLEYSFDNPVPLYAVISNLCLYLFLKNRFYIFYPNKRGSSPIEGSITAFYLIAYGVIRFLFEFIRKEKILALSLTQAQVAMLFFIVIGVVIFLGARVKKNVQHLHTN